MVLLEPAAAAAGTSLLPQPARISVINPQPNMSSAVALQPAAVSSAKHFQLPFSVQRRVAVWLDVLLTDSGARSRPTACAPRFAKSKTS